MSDPTPGALGNAPLTLDHSKGVGPEVRTPTGPEPPPKEVNRSLGRDAWRDLRRNPIFIVSAIVILFLCVMAIWPQLFTDKDPAVGDLSQVRQPPSAEHWFGTDSEGQDLYAICIYGARASILVGILTTSIVLVVGSLLGVVAAFYGRLTDSILSRVTDIFFGIPLLLGAMIVLISFPLGDSFMASVLKVVFALAILGWPTFFRLMRSSVLQVKQADYISAARAMGAGGPRVIASHIVPNSLAPVIVVATISLGAYIGAEATLSFLGIGLQPPTVSWGIAIADAQSYIRVAPHMLLFPGAFLSITVLAFILMGDAVRDAARRLPGAALPPHRTARPRRPGSRPRCARARRPCRPSRRAACR